MTLERQRSERDRAEKSRSRVRESDEPAFPEPGAGDEEASEPARG